MAFLISFRIYTNLIGLGRERSFESGAYWWRLSLRNLECPEIKVIEVNRLESAGFQR